MLVAGKTGRSSSLLSAGGLREGSVLQLPLVYASAAAAPHASRLRSDLGQILQSQAT
jgi:hypothetical protein